MNKSEVSGLYSDRMHRRCVDNAVFNCWMLTNFQSDDVHLPHTSAIVVSTISEIRDERVFTVMWSLACDEAREKTNWN